MALTPIEELLATGTDEQKLMRIRNYENAEIPGAITEAIETGNGKKALEGLQMLLDVSFLSNSLSDATLRRQYNPISNAYRAVNTFREVHAAIPRLVSDNQEKAFPI